MKLPDEIHSRAVKEAEEIEGPRDLYERGEELDYGLSGAIGEEWLRFPHEIDDEANCYEQAVFLYSIADAADMEPRFFEIYEDRAEMSHGFIDVKHDGERVLVDPFQETAGKPLYRPDRVEVEGLHDNEIPYKGIRKLEPDEILDTVRKYRENPRDLLENGQQIREEDLENGKFKERIETIEGGLKILSFFHNSDIAGFHHHGAITDLENGNTEFFDFERESWGNITRQHILTEDGKPRPPEELSEDSRYHITKLMAYQDRRDGDRIFTREDLDEFWGRYKENIEDHCKPATVYNGQQMVDELESLKELRDENPEEFHDRMDWLRFLDESEEIPELDSERLDSYLDTHRDFFEAIRDPELDQELEDAVKDTRDVETSGRDLPFDWGAYGTVKDTVSENAADMIDEVLPLLAADENAYSHAISKGDDRIQDSLENLLTEERDYDFYTESSCEWQIDRDSKKAVRRERIGEDDFSTLNSFVELQHSFEPDGQLKPSKIVFHDTLPYSDSRITHLEAEISNLDDLDYEELEDRIVEDKNPSELELWAPEPSDEFNLLDVEAQVVALTSIERSEAPLFHAEEELLEYFDQARENLKYSTDNEELLLPSLIKDSEKSIEILRERKDDLAVLEKNMIREYEENPEELQQLVDEELDQEEQYRNYLSPFLDTLDQMINHHNDKGKEITELLEEGYLQTIPSQEMIERRASKRDDSLDELVKKMDQNEPLDDIIHLLSDIEQDKFAERSLDTVAREIVESPRHGDQAAERFEVFRNLANI